MMSDFNKVLNGLHDISRDSKIITDDSQSYIEINNKRQFTLSPEFDTIIAYEGDVNTQVITIKCIASFDGHNLSQCAYRVLRWKNLASGAEGVSDLIEEEEKDTYSWHIPAEACTMAGSLEISVEFFDTQDWDDETTRKVFSWNTPSYSGLSVGKSLNSVALLTIPTDKLLLVDTDTKNIIAPTGYNNTICSYGEVGFAKVYFLVDKEVFDNFRDDKDGPIINVYVKMNGYLGCDGSNIVVEEHQSGKKLVIWNVPAGVTAGRPGPGEMQIMLNITNSTTYTPEKKSWSTNTYSRLKVAESILGIPAQGDSKWDLLTDLINEEIREYLEESNFIIDANL